MIGAGGAVAQYLVQLAVSCQYRVWATAAPRHHAHLLDLGVAGVFDYRDDNWRAGLQAAIGMRKLYAAFDTVSGAHAASLAPMLGYGGHLVCIQDRVEQHPLPPFSTAVSLHELALGSIHEYGVRADWVDYRTAGESMLQQLAMRTLSAPEIVTQPFEALPESLAALKAGQPGKRIILSEGAGSGVKTALAAAAWRWRAGHWQKSCAARGNGVQIIQHGEGEHVLRRARELAERLPGGAEHLVDLGLAGLWQGNAGLMVAGAAVEEAIHQGAGVFPKRGQASLACRAALPRLCRQSCSRAS